MGSRKSPTCNQEDIPGKGVDSFGISRDVVEAGKRPGRRKQVKPSKGPSVSGIQDEQVLPAKAGESRGDSPGAEDEGQSHRLDTWSNVEAAVRTGLRSSFNTSSGAQAVVELGLLGLWRRRLMDSSTENATNFGTNFGSAMRSSTDPSPQNNPLVEVPLMTGVPRAGEMPQMPVFAQAAPLMGQMRGYCAPARVATLDELRLLMASAAPALKHDDADDARTKEKVMVKKRVRRTVCNKVWREDEKKALEAGVIKYGKGAWAKILNDPDFRDALSERTNVDLKLPVDEQTSLAVSLRKWYVSGHMTHTRRISSEGT